jgi:Bacterial aa3 type cytochrome c oxidase subunit IV
MAKTGIGARFRAEQTRSAAQCAAVHEQGITAMADQDMKSAEQTYHGFLSWTRAGIIITAVITILVVVLISS